MARATDVSGGAAVTSVAEGAGFVVLLMPEPSYRALTEMAKREGMTPTQALATAVEDWVKRASPTERKSP